MVQARGLLRDPHPRLLRRQRRRLRRLPRADREARLPAVARASTASGCCRSTSRRCATAATTSPTSPRSTPTTAPSTTSTQLIEAAHARRIRVIADLVMNHTSSDHPWFQESRSGPGSTQARLVRVVGHRRALPRTRGSSSSTPRPPTGPGTRSAGAYYWHRFFSHQPDLNYDNPEVQEAMLERAALLARPRPRRLPARRRPLPVSSARARTARTCPRRTPT